MKNGFFGTFAALSAAAFAAGCLAIKTEHEVKPIQITMDVNLKVDKALEQELENEQRKQRKSFEAVKALSLAGKVGVDERGYLVARETLGEEEADAVEDANAARRVRMAEIAAETGASRKDVELKRAEKIRERIPAGVWYKDADGSWKTK